MTVMAYSKNQENILIRELKILHPDGLIKNVMICTRLNSLNAIFISQYCIDTYFIEIITQSAIYDVKYDNIHNSESFIMVKFLHWRTFLAKLVPHQTNDVFFPCL